MAHNIGYTIDSHFMYVGFFSYTQVLPNCVFVGLQMYVFVCMCIRGRACVYVCEGAGGERGRERYLLLGTDSIFENTPRLKREIFVSLFTYIDPISMYLFVYIGLF